MKSLFALTIIALATNTMASTMTCSFTEPFFTLKIESQNTIVANGDAVTIVGIDGDIKTKIKSSGITAEKMIFASLENNESGFSEMLIDLTKEGSDGMSDEVYQFEAIAKFQGHNLYGGCNLN